LGIKSASKNGTEAGLLVRLMPPVLLVATAMSCSSTRHDELEETAISTSSRSRAAMRR